MSGIKLWPIRVRRCRDGPLPLALGLLCTMALQACGGGDGGPFIPVTRPVAEVEVTSPIDTLIAAGRTVQLSATARDADGVRISGAQFTWRSSNTALATVSGDGLVEALADGSVTITATTSGVSGSLRMRVLLADLEAVAGALGDPLTELLVTHLSGATQPDVQAALNQCVSSIGPGNIAAIVDCIEAVRAEASGATDPTDTVLLAVLGLIIDHTERLLNL
ncbi:MAG: Ig-like domain-containing protein [Gemmatimonadota bacterium]|nr:MAG: Ig-like domain-containing protein [Gemmatimonadota bacterium]